MVGFAAGLAAVLAAGLRYGLGRVGLAVGLAVGLTVGLTHGLVAWLCDAITRNPATISVDLAFGLASGLVTAFSTNSDERLALGQDARRVIHDDLVAGLAYGLGAGLAFVFAEVLQLWLNNDLYPPRDVLVFGLTYGLWVGLWVGLMTGLAAGRHATASLLFAFTEIFPARPVQFLEWARNAGLLRVTGIAYQCRHDTYQQWLAVGAVDRGIKTTLDAHAGWKPGGMPGYQLHEPCTKLYLLC